MKHDFSRQSFLGSDSAELLSSVRVGVIGLSGGGSHIVQQLAHVGVQNFVIADFDAVSDSNLNRLVGATISDTVNRTKKIDVAGRVILGVNPYAQIHEIDGRWQDAQMQLRQCNVVFGCVDSYSEREQIERFCRRFLIVYFDIGMDVIAYDNERRIVGQVAQSCPGSHCLRCMNIINESKLKREAEMYGAAGEAPQVVWSNGVLASTAISLFVRLLTSWGPKTETVYLEYNGNDSHLNDSPRLEYILQETCEHFSESGLGDPLFQINSESGNPPPR